MPASFILQHNMQIVNKSTVAAESFPAKIESRIMELQGFYLFLHTTVGHRVIQWLSSNVTCEYIAVDFSDAADGIVPPKRLRIRISNQVLPPPFQRANYLRRSDVRFGADQKLSHIGSSHVMFKNANAIRFRNDFRVAQPFGGRREFVGSK